MAKDTHTTLNALKVCKKDIQNVTHSIVLKSIQIFVMEVYEDLQNVKYIVRKGIQIEMYFLLKVINMQMSL